MTKDTCEECRFFGKDACSHHETDPKHEKCSEFYRSRAQDKKKEKARRKQLRDSGFTENGCFEAIYHNEKPAFLVVNSGTFSIVESLELNGEELAPKELKHMPYKPYSYFSGSVPNREDLYWLVRREIQRFIDVESIWIDVLAAMVLLSYHQEKLQTVPYVFVYGDNESGKSTVLQILQALCYRPMYAVTVPAADLYGYLENSDAIGCILEDEVQGVDRDTDKIKIYKAGYKMGARVPRTILLEHDRIIKYYNTFCLKACASEQIPTVKGFRERFIEIAMVEGSPELEWVDVKTEDLKRLTDLRNQLLKWRMLSREWLLPDPELSWKGRLKEIWKPLLQITSGLTVYDTLFNFIEDQRKERLNTKQSTLEGHIVKVIAELYDEQPIPFSQIWDSLVLELEGKLDEKKTNQMDTPEFFTVTKSRIGYRLREILSGKTKVLREKGSDGNWISTKAYEFDPNKLRKVARKYDFKLVTKLPSLLSSEGAKAPFPMEKTMEKQALTPQELGKLSNSVTSESPIEVEEKINNHQSLGKQTSNSVTDIKAVIALDPVYLGSCFLCHQKKTLTWQVQYHSEEWGDCCIDCGTPLLEKARAGE